MYLYFEFWWNFKGHDAKVFCMEKKKKRLYTEWKNKFFAVVFYVTFYHPTFPTAVTDIETYQNGFYSDDHLFLSSVTFV